MSSALIESLLEEMYQDDYFPDFLVEQVQELLAVELVEFFSDEDTHEEAQEQLDFVTLQLNDLAAVFEENGSEFETVARDSIGSSIESILDHYKIDIEIEDAIRLREW